ncbi:hypothetical protein OSTOST_07976 [Ostertagia ostertagi]
MGYCNRVIIKDLHTGKIYRFPVHDWLGTYMGRLESERLAAVDNEVIMKNEVMSIHILAETISYKLCTVGGESKGLLYNMADNNPGDLYYYIVMVETGYRMCASTDSKVFITIYGTDADEVSRELKTIHIERNSSIFSWGTSARFLLKNTMNFLPKPKLFVRCLGDLRFVRLWVDNSGRRERGSWYCNRVIIKDLHTGKIYRFPVHDWLGTYMGDGESERLAAVDNEVIMKNEVMSIHILAETISLHSYVHWHIPSYFELKEIELLKNRNEKRKLPPYWPYGLGVALQLILQYSLIGLFILVMSANQDHYESHTHPHARCTELKLYEKAMK